MKSRERVRPAVGAGAREAGGELDDPSQRSGARRTLRKDGYPFRSRYFAVTRRRDHEILDQLLGPILSLGPQIREHFPSNMARASRRSSTTPLLVRNPQRWATRSCVRAAGRARHGREAQGRWRRAVEPCGDAVVGELRPIQHDGAVDVGFRDGPIGSDLHLDHDRQAWLVLDEGFSLSRASREAWRRPRPRCTRTSCWSGRARRLRNPPHDGINVGDGHADLHHPPRRLFGDESWSRSGFIVIDRAPGGREVADGGVVSVAALAMASVSANTAGRNPAAVPLDHRPSRDGLQSPRMPWEVDSLSLQSVGSVSHREDDPAHLLNEGRGGRGRRARPATARPFRMTGPVFGGGQASGRVGRSCSTSGRSWRAIFFVVLAVVSVLRPRRHR